MVGGAWAEDDWGIGAHVRDVLGEVWCGFDEFLYPFTLYRFCYLVQIGCTCTVYDLLWVQRQP